MDELSDIWKRYFAYCQEFSSPPRRRPYLESTLDLSASSYRAALSDDLVRSIIAGSKETSIHDTLVEPLFVRVRPNGTKVFYISRFNRRTDARQMSLGSVEDYTVDQARRKTLTILEREALEGPPRRKATLSRRVTFQAAFEQYLQMRRPLAPRIHHHVAHILDGHGSQRVCSVRRAPLVHAIEQVALKNPSQGKELHKTLRAFFSWCVTSGALDGNPLSRVQLPEVPERRKAYLSQEDLIAIYAGTAELRSPWRALVRFVVLSGMSVNSARWVRRDDIDFRLHNLHFAGSRDMQIISAHAIAALEEVRSIKTFLFQSPYWSWPERPVHTRPVILDQLYASSGVRGWSWPDFVRGTKRSMQKAGIENAAKAERAVLEAWTSSIISPPPRPSPEEEVVL